MLGSLLYRSGGDGAEELQAERAGDVLLGADAGNQKVAQDDGTGAEHRTEQRAEQRVLGTAAGGCFFRQASGGEDFGGGDHIGDLGHGIGGYISQALADCLRGGGVGVGYRDLHDLGIGSSGDVDCIGEFITSNIKIQLVDNLLEHVITREDDLAQRDELRSHGEGSTFVVGVIVLLDFCVGAEEGAIALQTCHRLGGRAAPVDDNQRSGLVGLGGDGKADDRRDKGNRKDGCPLFDDGAAQIKQVNCVLRVVHRN